MIRLDVSAFVIALALAIPVSGNCGLKPFADQDDRVLRDGTDSIQSRANVSWGVVGFDDTPASAPRKVPLDLQRLLALSFDDEEEEEEEYVEEEEEEEAFEEEEEEYLEEEEQEEEAEEIEEEQEALEEELEEEDLEQEEEEPLF